MIIVFKIYAATAQKIRYRPFFSPSLCTKAGKRGGEPSPPPWCSFSLSLNEYWLLGAYDLYNWYHFFVNITAR